MSNPLNPRPKTHIVLGVTGGIAAYKACELTRLLRKHGFSVQVVMTESAQRFVGQASFQALSGRPVFTDAWDSAIDNQMPHIELSREASFILVAPATADFLARLAQGRSDDLLTSLCLAREIPLAVAPAMNRQMWQNPATQTNVSLLQSRQIQIWGPDQGEQACGETGDGRMLEPEEIVERLEQHRQLQSKTETPEHRIPLRGLLAQRRVVITAGPTFEPIDPVRGITNRSSGQMGFALAQAAVEAGAKVTLIAGPVSLSTPQVCQRIDVMTAQEMQAAVESSLKEAGPDAVFIGVAAVADWRPAHLNHQKIKKESQADLAKIVWTENPDILAGVAARSVEKRPFTVGFAAETGSQEELENLLPGKAKRKGVDLLIGNLVHESLGTQQTRLTIFDTKRQDETEQPRFIRLESQTKPQQAAEIIQLIANRLRPSV
jgi:phosphopantothenoylcysteine decarboxylase/phosphopantothenate--cysteine ligase